MKNDLRQGNLLPPFLFLVGLYTADLIDTVEQSKICCYIGDLCVNILAYADDIVVLAPSWSALQILVNICAQCVVELVLCLMLSSPYVRFLFHMIQKDSVRLVPHFLY